MITDNLSTLKIHKLTQAQYERELAAGNIDETALYLTPEEAHNHDDRYYTEYEIDTKLSGKANTSHGNHVPSTQTADNSKFLRNDNTWATVTPANIGAAASSHNHSASNITSGTMSSDRLPVDDIVNLYVWKKYDGNPAEPTETSKTLATISRKVMSTNTSYASISYADSVIVEGTSVTLVEATEIAPTVDTANSTLLGKYVKTSNGYGGTYGVHYIPSDATFSASGTYDLKASKAVLLGVRTALKYVASKSNSSYPTSGEHTDGYWYLYHKQLGD